MSKGDQQEKWRCLRKKVKAWTRERPVMVKMSVDSAPINSCLNMVLWVLISLGRVEMISLSLRNPRMLCVGRSLYLLHHNMLSQTCSADTLFYTYTSSFYNHPSLGQFFFIFRKTIANAFFEKSSSKHKINSDQPV